MYNLLPITKMSSGSNKIDANLTGLWVSFFTAAGIPSEVAATYAITFTENRIQNDMLLDLNKEYLRDMGIVRMGDIIAILRHAKQVHESTARDRVLSTTVTKVPVAAVTGRTTVTQPASPASRILEHYTRNPPSQETSPVRAPQPKRKSNEMIPDNMTIKKSRLIRFGTPPEILKSKEAPSKTVFSRLGNSDLPPVKPTKPATLVNQKPKTVFSRLGNSDLPPVKPTKPATPVNQKPKKVFSRLGSKEKDQIVPIDKDALKYEGILKSEPKKGFTVTSVNNIRKIAIGTMRADEARVSVKEKLAIKPKSVKFSNHVEYKEIETKKFTQVFNKPERRLSMPESDVKARLGMKSEKKITITKNVFNRLGA